MAAKLNDPQLYIEFERIPKRKENARYECALLEENRIKNLEPHFLPYDDNRVRLTPTKDNRLGYVNASHITATVGSNQRFYIIAQSPHNVITLNIFWQCVWEADVYLLVQLSDEMNYVPINSDKYLEYGQVCVFFFGFCCCCYISIAFRRVPMITKIYFNYYYSIKYGKNFHIIQNVVLPVNYVYIIVKVNVIVLYGI